MGKRYHHGDLRAALIDIGLRLLAERNAEELSLRAMAREAGVSATSVYRHFPDKAALMQALAMTGLQRLADAQRQAAEGHDDPLTSFAATGAAYVRFALANPALFRLIFASSARARATGEAEALALLRANARAVLPADAEPEVQEARALRAWSLVHGMAMLMLDGQIPANDRLIEAVLRP